MKNLKLIFAGMIVFSAFAFFVSDETEKVKIIHNGRVIEVDQHAVAAHLAHGDTIYSNNPSSSSAE